MTRFLWLNWSGGGNLPPSLGIARVLTERGHTVAFAGRPEMVSRVQAAGFEAIEFKQAYAQASCYPQGSPLTNAACYLTSPAVEAEARSIVAEELPDTIIIDAMFPAALVGAPGFGVPTAVACHTFVFRQLDRWRQMIERLIDMRRQASFGSLPPLDDLWRSSDRVIVTAAAAFDAAPAPGWESVRHVGPVLEDEKVAVATPLPWADADPTPIVLVSFSTGLEQRAPDKLQRSLDALGSLPVHVVATTAGLVAPEELKAPANACVLSYAAHDPILRRAALVVTHGGHGTAMRSLNHGVPMIVMPGLAHDQPCIAATVQEWGVGRALPGDADVRTIRAAAQEVLSNSSYRKRAQQRAMALANVDGAAAAADELEELAAISRPRPEITAAAAKESAHAHL